MRKGYAQVYVSPDLMTEDPVVAREYAYKGLRSKLIEIGCDETTVQMVIDGELIDVSSEEEPEPRWEHVFRATARER